MTKRHVIELVNWRFPGVPEGVALQYLNNAALEFAQQTEIVRRSTSVSAATITHTLPADCLFVRYIWYTSDTGTETWVARRSQHHQTPVEWNSLNLQYQVEDELTSGAIGADTRVRTVSIGVYTGSTYTAMSSGTYTIIYAGRPQTLGVGTNDDNEIPDIPEVFHMNLVERVLENLYGLRGDQEGFNTAARLYRKWQQAILLGKQYARVEGESGPIRPHVEEY